VACALSTWIPFWGGWGGWKSARTRGGGRDIGIVDVGSVASVGGVKELIGHGCFLPHVAVLYSDWEIQAKHSPRLVSGHVLQGTV
jgi:Na+-translocating ferredoxin:NAD+ oxidoreductase RnfE subunit